MSIYWSQVRLFWEAVALESFQWLYRTKQNQKNGIESMYTLPWIIFNFQWGWFSFSTGAHTKLANPLIKWKINQCGKMTKNQQEYMNRLSIEFSYIRYNDNFLSMIVAVFDTNHTPMFISFACFAHCLLPRSFSLSLSLTRSIHATFCYSLWVRYVLACVCVDVVKLLNESHYVYQLYSRVSLELVL